MKPIANALDVCQREGTLISEAAQVWILLQAELRDMWNVNEQRKLNERFNTSVTDAHCLADMIHPRYMGKKLSSTQKECALNLMKESFPDFMPVYVNFSGRSFPFSPELLTKEILNSSSPLELWKFFENELQGSKQIQIPRIVFTAVASSAGVKRVFSSMMFVHSDLRNKLGNAKFAQLVTIVMFTIKCDPFIHVPGF